MARLPWIAAVAALALSACATQRTPTSGQGMDAAFTQPMRDLSIVREVAPDSLKKAVEAPYAATAPADCAALAAELAALDEALGPDIDTLGKKQGRAEGLAADLIRGSLSLPFRGVVREVTGAQKREAALRAAVTAGMVRRGFLKGQAQAAGCPAAQAVAAR